MNYLFKTNILSQVKTLLAQYSITIKNAEYFYHALLHNSYANEIHQKYNYQRLEFIGDAVIQLIISDYLYHHYPYWEEGRLTKVRASAVCQETLAAVCQQINLNSCILLGKGEIKQGGYEKISILGDVFESFTAAVYCDNNFAIAQKFLDKTLIPYVSEHHLWKEIKDSKSTLQEYLQTTSQSPIIYEKIKETKQGSTVYFTVQVKCDGHIYASGQDISLKKAEQKAASAALAMISAK